MTFTEITTLNDAQLNELAEVEQSQSIVARFAREEQLMRQLSGVSRSILTDIFTNPDAYDLSFDDVHMLSRYLVNIEARQTYRNSGGEISTELATELRFSFYSEQDIAQFADSIYRSIAAGAERPLSPKEFIQMGLRLGGDIFMLSDFEAINKELERVGSPVRYTGTQPQQSSPFLFLLFVTPKHSSIPPATYDPEVLLDFEREVVAPLISDKEDVRSAYLLDKADQLSRMRFFEVYCELVRSPALAPDANGVNLCTENYRYIHVWSEPLPEEFFL